MSDSRVTETKEFTMTDATAIKNEMRPMSDSCVAPVAKREEFVLTEAQYEAIMAASKPVPSLIVGGMPPPSPQENANHAWAALGKEMGFKSKTVRTIPGKNDYHFTAEVDEAVTMSDCNCLDEMTNKEAMETDQGLSQQLVAFVELDKRKRELKTQLARVKDELSSLEAPLLRHFENAGMQRTTVNGTTVYIMRAVRSSAKDIEALRDYEATAFMVKETVHAGTLSSWVNEQPNDDQGMPTIPPELKDAIKVNEMFSLRTLKT